MAALAALATVIAPAPSQWRVDGDASSRSDEMGITVELRARSVAPGEPLRIVVETAGPVASIGGEFLGRTLFFSRVDELGRSWSAWAHVPLDQDAGEETITVRGLVLPDRELVATRSITILPRVFPEERLRVAERWVEPPPEVAARLERERARLAELYRRRRAAAPRRAPFVRPVPGEPTSIFGLRRFYNDTPRSPHPGLDLRAATGTPVHASGGGIVVLAEELYYSGNTVILDHGGGLFTIYAHLSKIFVHEDEPVDAGDRLGLSGATGRVTGPHLHWGAKIGDEPFDPTALLDPALFR